MERRRKVLDRIYRGLLQDFNGDHGRAVSWFYVKRNELGGRSPFDAAMAGHLDEVEALISRPTPPSNDHHK